MIKTVQIEKRKNSASILFIIFIKSHFLYLFCSFIQILLVDVKGQRVQQDQRDARGTPKALELHQGWVGHKAYKRRQDCKSKVY